MQNWRLYLGHWLFNMSSLLQLQTWSCIFSPFDMHAVIGIWIRRIYYSFRNRPVCRYCSDTWHDMTWILEETSKANRFEKLRCFFPFKERLTSDVQCVIGSVFYILHVNVRSSYHNVWRVHLFIPSDALQGSCCNPLRFFLFFFGRCCRHHLAVPINERHSTLFNIV